MKRVFKATFIILLLISIYIYAKTLGIFEQVSGIAVESYEEVAGETDWFQNYENLSLDYEDKNHQNDFYVTEEKIGLMLGVPHAIGDYIILEIDAALQNDTVETIDSENSENRERTPIKAELRGGTDYDINDTIYYKNYYDDFAEGWMMNIRYPEVNLQKDMEDYFNVKSDVKGLHILADMFFDNRSIEMEEEELKALFYSHGYYLYLHNTELNGLHVRIIEIQEINGLSLYPSEILIQTWDDKHIYLEDITGPVPRKVRSILTIDDKEKPQMIIHSSGLSTDYVSEEELSFWEFRENAWALIPIELDIDTSHAHNLGSLYPDLDRDELFPAVHYRDGIVFGASIQAATRYGEKTTFRLGKLEETEKNKSFRLTAIYDNGGRTYTDDSTYIQFTIK